jgi:hypothetical protein
MMRKRFPNVRVHYMVDDFTAPLDLPPLNGLVIANALHFVKNKISVIEHLGSFLKTGGRFLLVEYNTDRSNRWVPHPISYTNWEKLASQAGLANTSLIAARPSRFLGEIYAALSLRNI